MSYIFFSFWRCQRWSLYKCGLTPHHLHVQKHKHFLLYYEEAFKAWSVSEVPHCSSVTHLDFDLTMFTHCNLAALILVLTLHDQGKALFIAQTFIQSQNGVHEVKILMHRIWKPFSLQFIQEKSWVAVKLHHIAGPTWYFWSWKSQMVIQHTVMASL